VRDPYRLLLLEQVGYLASDADRLAAFRLLQKRVGTDPDAILAAPTSALRAVARRGGAIGVALRAARLRQVALRVRTVWDGDLRPVGRLPLAEARRELTRYPAIGEPGAERILLLSGAHPVLGLDSNALRVLQRLGYGNPAAQWAKAYRSAQQAAERELRPTVAVRREAYLVLRRHGSTVCRRTAPRCLDCPVRRDCPTGAVRLKRLNSAGTP
jgi:endonuclease-3